MADSDFLHFLKLCDPKTGKFKKPETKYDYIICINTAICIAWKENIKKRQYAPRLLERYPIFHTLFQKGNVQDQTCGELTFLKKVFETMIGTKLIVKPQIDFITAISITNLKRWYYFSHYVAFDQEPSPETSTWDQNRWVSEFKSTFCQRTLLGLDHHVSIRHPKNLEMAFARPGREGDVVLDSLDGSKRTKSIYIEPALIEVLRDNAPCQNVCALSLASLKIDLSFIWYLLHFVAAYPDPEKANSLFKSLIVFIPCYLPPCPICIEHCLDNYELFIEAIRPNEVTPWSKSVQIHNLVNVKANLPHFNEEDLGPIKEMYEKIWSYRLETTV